MGLDEIIATLLAITFPFIKNLIESKLVPAVKRRVYQKVDGKIDSLIEDLAQNASKIATETDEAKKFAYVTGTKLGIDTIRAFAEKLNKAADEIEKVIK